MPCKILFLALWLLTASAVSAQTNAYAKFNKDGATIGLYNLLADQSGCGESRAFSGVITKVGFESDASAYRYEFTLGGRQILFTVGGEAILRRDAEDIVRRKSRVRVQARQCGDSRAWTAEEIRRF